MVLAVAVMAPMTRPESTGPLLMVSERVEQCADGAAPSRTTAPGSQASQAQAPRRPSGRARGRDGGRILVTAVSTLRLPVVAEMLRARWPSSPTSCSCGCLHKGSNAQAVSKTGEAARSLARADGQRKWRRAWRRARSLRSRAGAGADIARARPRARAPAACAPASRAQRQGRPKAAPHAWRPAGLGGAPVDCGLVSLGSEEAGDDVDRGVDHLARILAPTRVHCDYVCARRVVCVRSGVVWGYRVDLAWRLGEEGGTWAEIAPRAEAEIAPRTGGR